MASLTVRQLDDELKKRLRLRAAKSGRSVEDEVRTILREAAEQADDEAAHPGRLCGQHRHQVANRCARRLPDGR